MSSKPVNPPSFNGTLQQYGFEKTPTSSPAHRITRSTKNDSTTPSTAAPSPIPSLKRKTPLTAPSHSSSPFKKNIRLSSKYAPPSKYAHLPNHLTDSLSPNLITIFIGLNPGLRTASTGHAYAHPSNLFWKLLHKSGCTPRLCQPSECPNLPWMYALGNTNIVSRATKDGSELSAQEMDEGVEILEEKARKWRPESVCVVGKSVWESVWRVRHGRKIGKGEFRYGWQDEGENMGVIAGEDRWEGAKVFVATTTSGLAAGMKLAEKEEVWKGLGEWVVGRREERGIPDEGCAREEVEKVADEVGEGS